MNFVDDEARSVIRTGIGTTLFVEAGAGTGKTTEMVARITGLLADGAADIHSIVAITFTEAAAGELRERLRSSLERVRSEGIATQSARAADALLFLEDAAIQTIHGFAHRLVTRYAVHVGVPPVFEVLDRIQAKLLADERWSLFLRDTFSQFDVLDAADQQLIRVATALGLTQNQFRLLGRALQRDWQRSVSLAQREMRPPPALKLDVLVAQVQQALDYLVTCKMDADRMAQYLSDDLAPWFVRLRLGLDANDDLAVIETLALAPSFSVGNRGAKTNWQGEDLKELRELLVDIGATVRDQLNAPRQWAIDGLARLLARYVVGEARHRRVRGRLEFHDLLVYATDLARMPSVLASLRRQYRYLFIDEFQDTDALQVELIDRLAGVDRTQADDAAAELFTVGDSKQSIYRFRGADLTQFHSVRESGRAEVVHLNTNFRTVPSILDWVNRTFEPLVGEADANQWLALSPARSAVDENENEALAGVRVIGDAVEGLKARDVRELEAADVVQWIHRAKREQWLIETPQGVRPIRYGDIATLMPTRRSLPALERELRRAEVPYRVESRALIWSTQEIRDATSILRAVANPRDEIAIVAALRTPALACGDDDLLSWKQSGGAWRYNPESIGYSTEHPVGRALSRLADLHERRQWTPVSQFVADVISQMAMYELAFARPRQREAWHRLRFLVDRARAWTEAGGFGLQAFVQWIETQEKEAADAVESVVPEADDDAVRVMTIHASKGLEFPMVAIVGLGSSDTVTDSARLFWDADGRCQIRIGPKTVGWQTPAFGDGDKLEVAANSAEQARLLYVAATRARDHLLVSIYRPAGTRAAQSLAARLAAVLPPERASDVLRHPGESRDPAVAAEALETIEAVTSSALHWLRDETRPTRSDVIKNGSRSISLSATAIATQVAGLSDVLPGAAAASKDLDAIDLSERLRFGSAVHAGLEAIDLRAEVPEVEFMAARQATAFNLPELAEAIARSMDNALQSRHVQDALACGRWWREVPVFSGAADRVIGGSIDLLYEVDGELVVVDYKTEDVCGDTASTAALERYRWQLVTYAFACRETTGKRVREAALLFIPPNTDNAVCVSIDQLDESVSELTDSVLPDLF